VLPNLSIATVTCLVPANVFFSSVFPGSHWCLVVCRQSFLDELATLYRQTILFSSFESLEISALVQKLCNYEGLVYISSKSSGVLSRLVPQVCVCTGTAVNIASKCNYGMHCLKL
jgi:hypothetical protein